MKNLDFDLSGDGGNDDDDDDDARALLF